VQRVRREDVDDLIRRKNTILKCYDDGVDWMDTFCAVG